MNDEAEARVESPVAEHYTLGNVLERINVGLERSGAKTPTIEDLSAVDEFHIGGKMATEHFLPQLEIESGHKVLDVGCGIGGTARLVSGRYQSDVEGIDLTPEYIETGRALNSMVNAGHSVSLHVRDATQLEFKHETFDRAYTMHVCMNIEDKSSVFKEVFRVLKPGGIFGVYDVTKYGDADCTYPLPWAASDKTSFLESAVQYVTLLRDAGFDVEIANDRYEFAVKFFEAVKKKMAAGDGPPPLGIHVLMGDDAKTKVGNLTSSLQNGAVAPFEFIARKPRI